jgi:hypothetical protein
MRIKTLRAPAIFSLGLFPLCAAASAPNFDNFTFYTGLSFGAVSMPNIAGQLDSYSTTYFNRNLEVLEYSSQIKTVENGAGFTAGFRFNRYWALEASVQQLGKVTYTASGTARDRVVPVPITMIFQYRQNASAVSGIGLLPLTSHWEVFGRLGFSMLNSNQSFLATVGDQQQGLVPPTDEKTNLVYGVGTTYYFSQHWATRLEAQRYTGALDDTQRRRPLDRFSVELSYKF